LTKPDSALLSGEELNSCSHCEQLYGSGRLSALSLSKGFFAKLSLACPELAKGSKESGNDFILCK
jgi:hypothetical protein